MFNLFLPFIKHINKQDKQEVLEKNRKVNKHDKPRKDY